MNSYQAKRIPLQHILSRLGYEPHHAAKGQLWYLSPFREETEASFNINPQRNIWYDFGTGKGGTVIDFVMTYHHLATAREALQKLDALEGWTGSERLSPPPAQTTAKDLDKQISISKIQPLQNQALIKYLSERGIETATAARYIQEIYYTHSYQRYFALAFPNESGGYELRNAYFKGCTVKDISLLKPEDAAQATTVMVFEGFFDFLSVLTYFRLPRFPASVLVLNSVAMREKAVHTLIGLGAQFVHLYLDHDAAGRELTAYFQVQLVGIAVNDESVLYQGHKDFNVFLQAQRRLTKTGERSC